MANTGIYCITNIVNGKQYVGQSSDIEKRWREHRSLLRRNLHPNQHLQNAWNRYGNKFFSFSILQIVDVNELDTKEIEWIKKLGTYTNGYNLNEGGKGNRGKPLTEKQRQHLSAINKGSKNPNYGLKRSEETLKLMSIAHKGKKLKPHSDEFKKYMSELMTGRPKDFNNKAVKCIETGKQYKSLSEAAKDTGFSISGISKVCLGKRNAIHSKHFIFMEA